MNNKKTNYILWILIIIPYLALIPSFWWYFHTLNNIDNATFIVISKQDMTLKLYNYKGKQLQSCAIACGKNIGNKQIIGDMKTPEGVFSVVDIEKSSDWTHDFNDGKGKIKGAYGPYFIRLNVADHHGIGIHGTHDACSIGSRVTEGCIRIDNKELTRLVKKIKPATIVVITPGVEDLNPVDIKQTQQLNAQKAKKATASRN